MRRSHRRRDLQAVGIPDPKTPETKTRTKASPKQTALSRMVPSRTVQNLKAQSRRVPRKRVRKIVPQGKALRKEATSKSREPSAYLLHPVLGAVNAVTAYLPTSTHAQSDLQSSETSAPAPLCRQCYESYSDRSSGGTVCQP